jgi:type II secretory pathway pseudopilin PulG
MSRNKRNEAGFTLIELMIAGGVFAIGMVLVTGTVVAAFNHNRMTQARGAAADFNANVLESMRGLDYDEIMNFQLAFDDPDAQTVVIPGMGSVEVTFFAVIPSAVVGGAPTYFEIGVDDPQTIVDPPNPLEIQMMVKRPDGYEHYRVSTMVQY